MGYTLESARFLALILITFGSLVEGASAAVITFTENGGNVLIDGAGVISIADYNSTTPTITSRGTAAGIHSQFNYLQSGIWDSRNGQTDFYSILNTSDTFGFSGFNSALSNTSTSVFVLDGVDDYFGVPSGTTSYNLADISFTLEGSFATNRLTVGTYTFVGRDSSFSVQVGVIPEPSSTIILGFGGLSFVAFRRRRTN